MTVHVLRTTDSSHTLDDYALLQMSFLVYYKNLYINIAIMCVAKFTFFIPMQPSYFGYKVTLHKSIISCTRIFGPVGFQSLSVKYKGTTWANEIMMSNVSND